MGTHQAGNRVEHRGLAGTGWARQRHHTRSVLDTDMAFECAALQLQIDIQHQSSSRGCGRRTSHSDSSNAANEIASATPASRQMPDSIPGTCISP